MMRGDETQRRTRRVRAAAGFATPSAPLRAASLAHAGLALGACAGGTPSAPAIPLFGAYFPFWLICAAGGIAGAVLVRVALVWLGVDEGLPFRLLVYCGVATSIGFLLALFVFGR